MPDKETNGTSASDESKYKLAKTIQLDVTCGTNCSMSKPRAIEVKLSDGAVELRLTPKRVPLSDIETSTT